MESGIKNEDEEYNIVAYVDTLYGQRIGLNNPSI
jgi:hypothetical protein